MGSNGAMEELSLGKNKSNANGIEDPLDMKEL